jgi:microsomal dipeptidase-like Zn-dependent dipeptidase
LTDHPRNLADDKLRAIANAGVVVVVGVSFISSHLRSDGPAQLSDIADHVA